MFAGYIFTDCLVHFDEEFLQLVKNWVRNKSVSNLI
jgi:hypothetical protein